ncbi:nicotinamide N-methyltransferase-like [Clarias gariepinus]|uniref:nicotinamide N-methyltransferase-like n=1 Tax=Clarias gariepinus TaxID=13013 RepID=UPI00234CDB0F|nr:nicotinamide N-methyltransferase-like [Clarias gariepinus]
MAESSQFTEGDYYQECFNSRAYMNCFYRLREGHSDEEEYLSFVLGCLSKIFLTGQIKGRRLIEVGSGPTIHAVISACEHFDELVLSDFTDRNREEIEKWLKNEDGCFDWKPIIEYVCKLDGKRLSDVEVKLRQRVRRVLKCNVLSDNMFQPEIIKPAECVITSLCLEVACKDLPTYRDALCRVSKLVSPGGALVMIGVLGETFYYINKVRFSCLKLSKETIVEIIRNLGFILQKFEVFHSDDHERNKVSDHEAFFFLTALKPNKST